MNERFDQVIVYDFPPSSPSQFEHRESMLACCPFTNHADKQKENRQEDKRLIPRLMKKKLADEQTIFCLFVCGKQTGRQTPDYLIDFCQMVRQAFLWLLG